MLVFSQFVAHHMDQYREMEITKVENRSLKSENAAKEIKITALELKVNR